MNGNVIGAATNNQSGGPEADIANQAFGGGPYGAEVERTNAFFGYTFDANDSTRYFMNLLGGRTQSNDYDQRGIPHLASPWTTQIFVDNAYLPANVRAAMRAQGVNSFVMEKQGTVLGQSGNWGDSEDRHNQYDSWTLQLGLDKDIGERWQMQARIQRGATDRFTEVKNEIRVDREMLAIDAVEVYTDRRDLTNDAGTGGPDGRPDLITDALRGTGTIICNVQRYNPTDGAAAGVGRQRPRAGGAGRRFARARRRSAVPRADPGARRARRDPELRADEHLRPGQRKPGGGRLRRLGQVRQERRHAGVRRAPVHGRHLGRLRAGRVLDGRRRHVPRAVVLAARLSAGHRGLRSAAERGRAHPADAFMDLGIRGIQGGFTTGSPNLHEFSTVPTIKGGYDVWEAFTEFNMPLWQAENSSQRLEVDVAARRSDYSTSGVINSWKTGINLQVAEFLRFRRHGIARRARGDVQRAVRRARRRRQHLGERDREPPIPTGDSTGAPTTFQITTTAIGNPDLTPEEADTMTAGFVVEPQQTGLQFSIDWYDIDLSDAIGQLGVQRIVNECRAAPGSQFCDYVFRDPGTNAVTAVRNPWLNINNARVRGLDYELLWNKDTDFFGNRSEALTLRFLAGRLLEDSTTTPGGQPVDSVGPAQRARDPRRWRRCAISSASGASASRSATSARARSTSARSRSSSSCRVRWCRRAEPTIDDATVDAKSYTDLTVSYDRELSNGRSWQLALAITNAGDEDPPVIPTFDQRFSSQTNPANAYDVYGRRFLATFSYRL